MPVKMGKKTYKTFKGAQRAIAKKKGISMKRAGAYVASVERKRGINPRTGKKTRKK